MPTLYLIPTTLGDTSKLSDVLPSYNSQIIGSLKYFIVENIRTARRFLKKTDPQIDIDSLTFFLLNKRTDTSRLSTYLQPIQQGHSIGILSEAGCPAIADPGADVVAIAQQKNIKVVPLVGPSSILLSLMASGFNGQSFAFLGYLPIDSSERIKTLKKIEKRIYTDNQTQLFIETPYRNIQLFADILSHCQPSTKLCLAVDITLSTQYIKTNPVSVWKTIPKPDLNKRPCVFLLHK